MPRGQGGCRRHEEPETPPDAQKGASNFVCPAAPRASQPEFRASRLLLRPVRAEQSHWRKPGSGWGREQSPPEPCQPGYESHCESLAQPAGPVMQTNKYRPKQLPGSRSLPTAINQLWFASFPGISNHLRLPALPCLLPCLPEGTWSSPNPSASPDLQPGPVPRLCIPRLTTKPLQAPFLPCLCPLLFVP